MSGESEKCKMPKVEVTAPYFEVYKGFVVVIRRGCGVIREAKTKILINKTYCDYIFYGRGVWVYFW